MSFVLRVEGERWRAHAAHVLESTQRLDDCRVVPVVKGNGYGLGQQRLLGEAIRLGADVIAVGTVFEAKALTTDRDVLVLEPFDPRDAVAAEVWWKLGARSERIIRTISSLDALHALAEGPGHVRVVLEALTSTHRFGIGESELLAALADAKVRNAIAKGYVHIEGLALHLPMSTPATGSKVNEVVSWAGLWDDAIDVWPGNSDGLHTLWVSHLSNEELTEVRKHVGDLTLRPRIGTALWHGDRSTLQAFGTVLAVHPLADGTAVGYRQRKGPKGGTLVVVSGGTSHGVGLSAPSSLTSTRARMVAAGTGALDAAGRALSPFTWAGKQRWFAEPPHMHVSLLWLPGDCVIPKIGDEMSAQVRFTTSHFDAVLGLD